jgi:hypothetical protein
MRSSITYVKTELEEAHVLLLVLLRLLERELDLLLLG